MPDILTAQQYLNLNGTDGDDSRYELVDGELIEMPPESDLNNAIAFRILVELLKHITPQHLIRHKDTEIEVAGRRVRYRVPDLLVHSEESLAALQGTTRATITRDMPPPILVIEVVSPGKENRDRDYRYKYVEYAARGISEYWIVDPEERRVTVCEWIDGMYEGTVFNGGDRIISNTIPTWEMAVEQVFDPVQ